MIPLSNLIFVSTSINSIKILHETKNSYIGYKTIMFGHNNMLSVASPEVKKSVIDFNIMLIFSSYLISYYGIRKIFIIVTIEITEFSIFAILNLST